MLVSIILYLWAGLWTIARASILLALLSRALRPEIISRFINFILGNAYVTVTSTPVEREPSPERTDPKIIADKFMKTDEAVKDLNHVVRSLRVEEIKASIVESKSLSDQARQAAERVESIESKVLEKIQTVEEVVEKSLHNLRTKFIPITARALAEETALLAQEKFEKKVKHVEDELKKSQAEVSHATERMETFHKRMERGLDSVQGLERTIEGATSERIRRMEEAVNAKMAAASKLADEAKALGAELHIRYSALPSEVERMKEQITRLQDTAAAQAADLTSLRGTLLAAHDAIARLQAAVDRGPEELQGALQAATGPLLERLTETREALTPLEYRLESLHRDLEPLKAAALETQALAANLALLETQHTQLETQHTQLETQHTQLEAQHTAALDRLALLEARPPPPPPRPPKHHADLVTTHSPRASLGDGPEEPSGEGDAPGLGLGPRKGLPTTVRVTPPSSPAPKPPLSPVPRPASPGSGFLSSLSSRLSPSGGALKATGGSPRRPGPLSPTARALHYLDPEAERAADDAVTEVMTSGASSGLIGSLPIPRSSLTGENGVGGGSGTSPTAAAAEEAAAAGEREPSTPPAEDSVREGGDRASPTAAAAAAEEAEQVAEKVPEEAAGEGEPSTPPAVDPGHEGGGASNAFGSSGGEGAESLREENREPWGTAEEALGERAGPAAEEEEEGDGAAAAAEEGEAEPVPGASDENTDADPAPAPVPAANEAPTGEREAEVEVDRAASAPIPSPSRSPSPAASPFPFAADDDDQDKESEGESMTPARAATPPAAHSALGQGDPAATSPFAFGAQTLPVFSMGGGAQASPSDSTPPPAAKPAFMFGAGGTSATPSGGDAPTPPAPYTFAIGAGEAGNPAGFFTFGGALGAAAVPSPFAAAPKLMYTPVGKGMGTAAAEVEPRPIISIPSGETIATELTATREESQESDTDQGVRW